MGKVSGGFFQKPSPYTRLKVIHMDENGGRFRRKKVNFSAVSNEILRDDTISLKAKGLYALIQSYITLENFSLYKGFLQSRCKEGDRAFESAWKELKDTGYLVQYQTKDEQNRFFYEYELMDIPLQFPGTTFCGTGECTTYKTYDVQNVEPTKCTTSEMGVHNNTIPNNTLQNNTLSNHIVSIKAVQEQISYETFPESDLPQLDEIVMLITEILNREDNGTIRIAKGNTSISTVKERFRMLDQFHIQYVLETLRQNTSDVRDIKGYILTCLYNAPATINGYYQQRIQHDFGK